MRMADVCLWHLADMAIALANVRYLGVKRTLVGTGAEGIGRE
jgi:hypothetical protein